MINKFHLKQSNISRKIRERIENPLILIACEGKKTEKCYFDSFRLITSQVSIITKGVGRSTINLINETIDIKKEIEGRKKIKFDQVWCVFDKDNNTNFNQAIELGKKHRILIAYSNQAFELWYILHFVSLKSPLSAKELINTLNRLIVKFFGKNYEKNIQNIYDLLEDRKHDAIKNAQDLILFHKANHGINPEKNNPSTTVHELVLELNKYIKN